MINECHVDIFGWAHVSRANPVRVAFREVLGLLTGSEVIRAAIKVASVGTSVAYPITPQSESMQQALI